MQTLMSTRALMRWGVSALLLAAGVPLVWPPVLSHLLSSEYMPHGHCYFWEPLLVGLHAASDTLIGLAYVAISLTLAYFVGRTRGEVPFHWVFVAFGVFIIACGLTHFMEVVVLWEAVYWLSGYVKVATALASVVTAIALPPLIPRAIGLVQSARISDERKRRIEETNLELERANEELRVARRSLERRVEEQEAAFQTVEARLKSFFESNVIGIVLCDVDGPVHEANDAFLSLVGHDREALRAGRVDWRRLTPPEWIALDERGIAEAKAHGTCVPYEKELVCGDGTRAPILVGYTLVGRERREAVAFVLDITSQKKAQAEREQLLGREQAARRDAEEASRLKDDFLAMVSHELRTPLNAILGYTTLLAKGQLDPAATTKAVEAVHRNARSQAQIVDDLLDVSRIITGKLRLEAQPVELPAIVDAAATAVRPAAEAKGIKLDLAYTLPAGPVLGDPARLQQVVWNLLSNAVKFTPAGGAIRVSLARSGSDVEVVVSDTGQGIEPEFLPYVFDRFRQADASVTRRHGGLGLGLSIVRHLVELHGGTVAALSDGKGKGATFRVVLPLMVAREPEVPSAAQAAAKTRGVPGADLADLTGVRVLAVDDERDTREMLELVLAQCGAAVVTAESADAALEILGSWRPDVLVSDIGMPDRDGYSLIRAVRGLKASEGGAIPAVALTAYARIEDRMRALQEGYHLHVAKPIEPAELAAVIASLALRR